MRPVSAMDHGEPPTAASPSFHNIDVGPVSPKVLVTVKENASPWIPGHLTP